VTGRAARNPGSILDANQGLLGRNRKYLTCMLVPPARRDPPPVSQYFNPGGMFISVPGSEAAPLPTNVGAMKAMLDNGVVQARYGDWGYRSVGYGHTGKDWTGCAGYFSRSRLAA